MSFEYRRAREASGCRRFVIWRKLCRFYNENPFILWSRHNAIVKVITTNGTLSYVVISM